MSTLKNACVLLVQPHPPHPVLAINRRDNPDLWCIIGGKIDPEDASPLDAALREFSEEAGFAFHNVQLDPEPLHSDGVSVTYLARDFEARQEKLGQLNPEGLQVTFQPMAVLCHPETSPFWSYNLQLARRLQEKGIVTLP